MPRIEKKRSRRFCRDKCQLCGVGSSCKFYYYGNERRCLRETGLISQAGTSVICNVCYKRRRKNVSPARPTEAHQLQVL
jgi:hypothetical protein